MKRLSTSITKKCFLRNIKYLDQYISTEKCIRFIMHFKDWMFQFCCICNYWQNSLRPHSHNEILLVVVLFSFLHWVCANCNGLHHGIVRLRDGKINNNDLLEIIIIPHSKFDHHISLNVLLFIKKSEHGYGKQQLRVSNCDNASECQWIHWLSSVSLFIQVLSSIVLYYQNICFNFSCQFSYDDWCNNQDIIYNNIKLYW